MSDLKKIAEEAGQLAEKADDISRKLEEIAAQPIVVQPDNETPVQPIINQITNVTEVVGVDPLTFGITIFVLACFVGYFVVWKVTPALHTPLMAITNAISGIIIVGAIIAVGGESNVSGFLGFMAATIASINIFGGFVVTQRMLHMFKKKR